MSWKAEIIMRDSPQWHRSRMRFATQEEAEAYAHDLADWFCDVRATRTVECAELVTAGLHYQHPEGARPFE